MILLPTGDGAGELADEGEWFMLCSVVDVSILINTCLLL